MKVILASNNAKKILELSAVLPPEFTLCKMADFDIESPEETGTTFVENAIIKARYASEITGLPAIADDSGLEVDHLLGAPGIYSSRFAGLNATDADNNIKLLADLEGIESAARSARFRSVIVYMRHAKDPMPIIAHGTMEGGILQTPRGENGFGYDPLFQVAGRDLTTAEMPAAEKQLISHRGLALISLKKQLAV